MKGKDRGFTLIEVLVSLFILSIIFAILYGTFSTTHTTIRELEGRLEDNRTLRTALQIISKDLRAAYISGRDTKTLFKGVNTSKDLAAPMLSFTTYTPYQREGSLRVLRVEYLLKTGNKDGIHTLVRRVMEKDSQSVLDNEELIEGMIEVELSYYDGKEWKEDWNSSISKSLPYGIKMTMSTINSISRLIIPIEGGYIG